MTNVIMHEANFHKFTQNKELKQELLSTTGTTIAQACPFRGNWGTGYYSTEHHCHNRHTWTSMNKLGEILTNLREELIHSTIQNKVNNTQINTTAVCFEFSVDLATQQRNCPELGHFPIHRGQNKTRGP